MKKIFSTALLFLLFFAQTSSALAINETTANTPKNNPTTSTAIPRIPMIDFEKGLNDKKPMMVLLYASWADDVQAVTKQFNALKRVYGNTFNYVLLDIASPQAKSYNKVFAIQPNLPYIMMFKSKAKITRFVPKSCILDNACLLKTTKSFAN